MKEIKTLKSLYKYTHNNPNQEIIYISERLSAYITTLQNEYMDSIIRGIPMNKKHKNDYFLFNDCILLNGITFLVKEKWNK